MGKKVLRIFIMGFVKAVVVLLSMILCAMIGFFGTRFYYKQKQNSANKKEAESLIGKAQMDEVSKNLIYVWDEDKSRITSCVLEVFDTEKNTMTYITIPVSSQIVMNASMYKKISQVNKEIPQVFTLSKLCSYFDDGDTKAYGYGVLILEDTFSIDISYYTVVDQDTFEEMFETKEVEIDGTGVIKGDTVSTSDESSENGKSDSVDPYAHDDRFATSDNYADATTAANGTTAETEATTEAPEDVVTTVKIQQVKASYLEKVSAYTDKSEMADYVKEMCGKVKSNLDTKDKLSYVDKYLECSKDITYRCVPGSYSGKTYEVDLAQATKMLRNCRVDAVADDSSSDDSDDSDDANGVDSQLFNIVILNSTGVQGVAAKWSDTLNLDGYNVKKVGNYTQRLEKTKIVVKEDGQGSEFMKYFDNAEIEVGTVPDGVDAQIIIGTNDVKQ